MAERGGGIARFLTSSPNEEDITSALEEVLQEWSAPAALGLRLEVDHPGVQASGRDVTATSTGSVIDLGDLASGRSIWVAGRVPCSETEPVALRLTSTRGEIAGAVAGPEGGEPAGAALKALFGARRVLALEYLTTSYAPDEELWDHLERMGYDPASLGTIRPGKPGKVYAENTREELSSALRELLVRESLEYGLASAETAFVAVRTEAGHAPQEQVIVPNALPAGWDASFNSIASSPARYSLSAAASAPAAPLPPSPVSMGLEVPPFFRRKRSGDADPAGTTYGAAGAPRKSQSYSYSMREVPTPPPPVRLWSGAPHFADGEALLFDRSHSTEVALPEQGTLTQLSLSFPQGTPRVSEVSAELWLELYVEDAAAPRVRIRVRDLLRQGGRRPLNLRFEADHLIRLVLRDPDGAWAENPPPIEVLVACG
jgi:Ca-activated chloride channel family protein